jgi:hypothetical protein
MWWHAGRFVVASIVQCIEDCPAAIRKSKNPIRILLAYGAALWVRSELRNAHHRLVKKEKRRHRPFHMSRSWKRTSVMSSKALSFPDDEWQALLVISWEVKVLLRQARMEAWRCRKKHTCRDEEGATLPGVLAVILDQRLVSSEAGVRLVEHH